MKKKSDFINENITKKYDKNIFTVPLGDKYAKKFYDVYNGTLETRDQLMKDLYDYSKNDTSISEKQRKIIAGCYIAYIEAIGKNNVSMPLILFVKNKKPNLTKCLDEKRIKRVIEDLYSFVEKTGFEFQCYNLFDLLKHFLISFAEIQNHEDEEDPTFELYVIIALSKFVRTLPYIAYPQMWFGLMMMKNISLLSFVNIRMVNNDIINEVKNLIELINIIHALELQRSGITLKSKEEKDNEEKSVILPNEHIDIGNKFIQEENPDIIQKQKDSSFQILNPNSTYSPIITDINQLT